MNRIVDFYTDGAYSSKTERGGYACVVVENGDILGKFTGGENQTTNNRMELQGFLTALKVANEIETPSTEINIFCDSAYIVNCFDQQWYLRWQLNGWIASNKKPVKNQDLWHPIIEQYVLANRHLKINIYKVDGHSGNFWNEIADKLAVETRKKLEV